jgi:hypothetical protein
MLDAPMFIVQAQVQHNASETPSFFIVKHHRPRYHLANNCLVVGVPSAIVPVAVWIWRMVGFLQIGQLFLWLPGIGAPAPSTAGVLYIWLTQSTQNTWVQVRITSSTECLSPLMLQRIQKGFTSAGGDVICGPPTEIDLCRLPSRTMLERGKFFWNRCRP